MKKPWEISVGIPGGIFEGISVGILLVIPGEITTKITEGISGMPKKKTREKSRLQILENFRKEMSGGFHVLKSWNISPKEYRKQFLAKFQKESLSESREKFLLEILQKQSSDASLKESHTSQIREQSLKESQKLSLEESRAEFLKEPNEQSLLDSLEKSL